MPKGTPYSNKLHGVLKEAYGEKFVLTEDQFFDKITNDPAYQEKIYGVLKDAYKDDFTLTPKDFYDKLKKKEGTTENLQIPSQLGGKAFTMSSEEPEPPKKKRPYQDISYKPEPLQADVISTQVPNPIQKAVTTGGKVSPAASNPRIIEDNAFKASVLQSTADPVQKDLFNYDMYADEYDRLEKVNGSSEKQVIDNIRKYDPELWQELSQGVTDKMVGNGGLGENLSIDDFRTASKAIYQRYLAVMDEAKSKLKDSNVKADKNIDEIVKQKINDKTFDQYTKADINYKNVEVARVDGRSVSVPKGIPSGQKVVDIDKINQLATEIVDSYGLKDGGKAWQLVFNKLKSAADYEIDRGRAEQILAEKYPDSAQNLDRIKTESAKIAGMTPEQFSEYWTGDDAILARYEALAKSASSQALKDAEMEASVYINDYTYNHKRVESEYKAKQDALSAQAKSVEEMRRLGNIDDLTYNQTIAAIEDQLKQAYDKYEKDFQGLDQYVKAANEVYSRYNRSLKNDLEGIQQKADEELTGAFNKYVAMFEDPAVLAKIQNDYSKAHQEASLERANLMGEAAYENNPLTYFLRSTKQALGGVISGYGGYFDSKLLKVLGETVAQNNKIDQAKAQSFTDLLDAKNLLNLTGQLGGSMLPGMVATATVAAATGGAGVPTIVPMIAGGVTGWLTESMDIAGRAYNDMFEKTNGDVEKASDAFRKAFNSQYDLMGTYAFSALPFVGGALSKISSKTGRILTGAAIEYGEEYIQEFNQNIAEENISEGRDAWEGYSQKILDPKRHKENAITLAPTLVLGGLGQVRSKSPGQQAADAYMAIEQKTKINPAFKDQERQYIQSVVFERNADFAKSMVSTLFTAGKINEDKATDMLIEVERAQRIKDSADAAKLKGDNRIVYSFFASRAEDAERSAKIFHDDPIMSKVFEQQAKDYQQAGIDFINGKTPELYSITFADGSQNLMTQADMADIMQNENALDMISDGNVQISSYGSKTGSNSLETLREKVAQYEQNKKITEEKKVSGDSYNNTIDVLNAIKNNEDYKDKVTSHPNWSTLSVEEQDEVMLLTDRLSRFEREKAAVEEVGVESASLDEKIKTAKQDLSNLLNKEPNDNKNVPGVSSEVGEGQEPVEEEPVEGPSGETTEAGGVLQAPEEEVTPTTEAAPEAGVKDDIKALEEEVGFNRDAFLTHQLAGPFSNLRGAGSFGGHQDIQDLAIKIFDLIQEGGTKNIDEITRLSNDLKKLADEKPDSENRMRSGESYESLFRESAANVVDRLNSLDKDINRILFGRWAYKRLEDKMKGKVKTPDDLPNTLGTYLQNISDGSYLVREGDTEQNWPELVNNAIKEIESIFSVVPYPEKTKGLLNQIKEKVSNGDYAVSDLTESLSEAIRSELRGTVEIAEAYSKAKVEGSNPELVAAVEGLIGKPIAEAAPESAPVAEEPAKPKGKKKAEPKAEKPKRQQVEESLKKLRDQGLLVTADTSLLAKAKKLVGKKPKPVPMSDKEIAAQMKLLDAMAKVWKNVTGKDTYYDEFINEVKKGDLKKLQDMGGVLYQEEGDEKLAMPFKARVSLALFVDPKRAGYQQFKDMEGKIVAAQNVKDMVKTKAGRGEKPILEMVLDSPKYRDQKRFSFDEFKNDVELAVMNLEKYYTNSYAVYGMDYMGPNLQQYGNANTVVFNAPVSHGYIGHWPDVYTPYTMSKRSWVLREIPNAPGTFVAWDVDAPANTPEDQLMNYVGTAGPRAQVERWIEDIKTIREGAGRVKIGLFGHIRTWFNTDTRNFFVAELQADTHQKYKKDKGRPIEQAFVSEVGRKSTQGYLEDVFYPAIMTDNLRSVLTDILEKYNIRKGETGFEIGIPNDEGGFDFHKLVSYGRLNDIANESRNKFFEQPEIDYIKRDYHSLSQRSPVRDMIFELSIARAIHSDSSLVEPGDLAQYPHGAFVFARYPERNNWLGINYEDYLKTEVIPFDSENQFAQFKYWMGGAKNVGNMYDEMTKAAALFIDDVVKKQTNLEKFERESAQTEMQVRMRLGGFNYEKQFLDLDKTYMTRLFRESIRLAAESGAERMLIPYPRTLAKIEMYIGRDQVTNVGNRDMPYETPDGSDSDLERGDVITYDGQEYRVVEADSTSIKVAPRDRTYTVNYAEDVRERAYNDLSEVEYELQRSLDRAGYGRVDVTRMAITQEHIDVWKGDEDAFMHPQTVRIMQKALDENPTIEDDVDEDGNVIGELRYIEWREVDDKIADDIERGIWDWGIEDFYGDQQVFQDGDYVYLVDYGTDVLEFQQPDQYEEIEQDVVGSPIATIAERDYDFEENYRSQLNEKQATVISKYISFKKEFRKLRPDAKTFVDENDNLWLSTEITPEDLNNPIIAFQKEGEKAKAAIDFMIDQKATVHIFKGADISSLAHEMTGHIGRRVLERLAAQNADFAKDYEAAKKWAGVDGDFWHTAAEEKFARGFERYLRSGKAPNKSLQSVFNKLREWLSNIYEQIKGGSIDVNITPRMKKVFDNLLAYKPEPKKETKTKAETKTEEVKRKPKQEILDKAKRLADLYREIKSGNVSVRPELDDLLDSNPKLKYLYKNLPSINAKLEKDGLITKKTDGCP